MTHSYDSSHRPDQVAKSLAETSPDGIDILAGSGDDLSRTNAVKEGLILYDNRREILLPKSV